jgi:hypothetical protein
MPSCRATTSAVYCLDVSNIGSIAANDDLWTEATSIRVYYSLADVPAGSMNFNPHIHDHPEQFDALRYYNMRMAKNEQGSATKAAEVIANSQLVSVGTTSLTFSVWTSRLPW